ncbi:phenylalanine--tRNA ligase subunit beta [Desulfuromonas sp. AOP6]|uniref:phenylalanine--tRNA ligase subunit beta n=1 Tax=Desulfuromonas sp. AOP6 TaxID=1566351 RepID=UPI001274010B|nr:phenylalanine--tRNA ligase subunit beta [Desulfuromonas sp. AOP6]BCA79796.1 phenylalanine--tRNA ligase beta subunit [Desulfuromonas sp. AOP6]
MIVTSSWIKEFVDFNMSADDLSHRLTLAGLEVDSLEKIGEGLDSVIVAKLVSVEPHPQADRLTVCQVDTGSECVQVVCGATNHKAGDHVALAQVGSILPGDFQIKKSKIRGIESQGMLCSECELGIAGESAGILILPKTLPLGVPVFDALKLKDARFEIGLTPNRSDCLSVLGVSREVGAMVGKPVLAKVVDIPDSDEAISDLTSVTIEEPELCPRYAARLIQGVKIDSSPDWMVRRLESLGMRSINNVVDITNYVMMELGHPLHAFDFSLLRGKKIIIKRAGEGEKFNTLDGQERELNSSDLVICDAEGPVALAGIMGGENSEIQAETADILLESAYFSPQAIRRTSKRLGIHSESSHRFERGADINMVPLALNRAAALIQELAGGKIATGMLDIYPNRLPERKVTVSVHRTNEVLGLSLRLDDIERLLRSIGLAVERVNAQGTNMLNVAIPSFRHDLEREIDLIEEVARLNGYDKIPVTMPVGRSVCHAPPASIHMSGHAKDFLVGAGFCEIINYSFVSPSAWDAIGLPGEDPRRQNVKILNPLTEEQSVMRTTLVPSILQTVARNLAYRSRDLRLFELRPVFMVNSADELPRENLRLCAILCGRREPEGWAQSNNPVDFYDLKGVAEGLLNCFQVNGVSWEVDKVVEPYLHPGKSCALFYQGKQLGVLGEVHPQVLEKFEIDTPVYLLDMDVSLLQSASRGAVKFQPLSRFPEVYRDSAFLVDESTSAQEVLVVANKAKSPEVVGIVLFDVYRGKGVPEGKKSIAIRVRYRSMDKTLTDEEIASLHGKIIKALEKRLGAEIR